VTDRLRLGELLASLSIVADLGYSLPPDHALRTCLLGTLLAQEVGASRDEVADTFFTALLAHVGCVSFAHEMSQAFGDDQRANRAGAKTNFADPREIVTTLIPETARGLTTAAKVKAATTIVARGRDIGKRYDTTVCEVGRETARRIGLSTTVQTSLYEIKEWWNGRGTPRGLRGEEISLPARIGRTASEAALFDCLNGPDAAVDAVRRRSGTILDPGIAETFCAKADVLLRETAVGDPRGRMLELEPEPVVEIPGMDLVDVAMAFADLADLKTPFSAGHSRGVAELARLAAERLGLDDAATAEVHLAALLHNLGRVAVSNAIWEKHGPLTTAEWEQVRMHPYHSERILSGAPALAPLARIVGMHHERLDGSGYHRGCHAREVPIGARIVAAADAFQAMAHSRPYRAALTLDDAADELRREAEAGRLDADVVAAVLDVVGHRGPTVAKSRPAGLSDREIAVLRLLSEGCSNPQIAERLHVSRRTAEHHVQHIYTKIGVSSRAAAALFALENELLK
jgi:HD-GYP domain-containing protein (c-di-GMP phosphodiesterase class II)